jgi:hypothetical protein
MVVLTMFVVHFESFGLAYLQYCVTPSNRLEGYAVSTRQKLPPNDVRSHGADAISGG